MALIDPEAFGDEELSQVFLAPGMKEARRAEAVLSERGVDYLVQPEAYGRTLFGSRRMGAVFYVRSSQAEYCAVELTAAGLGWGVLTGEGDQ
jgi:hypothetical protein